MSSSEKKILITGANGLLGANTARTMHGQGYQLRLMVRPSADTKVLADIPCELYYGDITNARDVANAVNGCDYVIHAASLTRQWGVSYQEYQQANITSTKNVVAACLQHKVSRLIYVSTANTMGPGTREKPGSELSAFSFQGINSGYINSKYVAQQFVLEQVESAKLPAVIVNPTFMIGPYDGKPSSGQIILYGINKSLLFYPPGGKNFVAAESATQGILQALRTGKTGDCYLLAGENLSYREFFSLLNKVSGRKNILIPIPSFILKTLGMAGTLLEKLTGIPAKLNYASARLLCIDNYYSGKKSERELRVRYTPIEEATESALRWFRENGYC